ncbi:MAG: sulfoxide reductase heme-binding subunit YedZ [Nitrospiraceae bacterium]|nr:MAG: sulfoxide reductase heme-binding subunit YedZ [Nitrospiraceae bacterium]
MHVSKRFQRIIKPSVFTVSLFPLFWLIGAALTEGLGANPIEKVLHHMGDWALSFLMITLVVSPFGKMTGLSWPIQLRRMMGLFGFFYATLHFMTYIALDQFFDWRAIVEDAVRHKRIIVGFASYILLIPLAVTSTNSMIQKLGFKTWQRLHRLVYAAAGGILHFLWLVKVDTRRPLIYASVFAVLMALRIVHLWMKKI